MDKNVDLVMHYLISRAASDINPTTAVTYDAGYIVLSFFVSLLGCITTLELLQRRTSTHGAYNWYVYTSTKLVAH
jgi:NO-binding membrane sensor protein with MHYT domain